MKITKQELLNVSDKMSEEYIENFNLFLNKINLFRDTCNIPMIPTSYFRSKDKQRQIYQNKAKKKEFPFTDGIYNESKVPFNSVHLKALGCDFGGKTVKQLMEWIQNNLEWCKQNGFYFEDFNTTVINTKSPWIHIQIVSPKSGKVIFKP